MGDKRNVIVVLRLVLDVHGRLMHGELVDVEGTLQQRFKGQRGLAKAMRMWLVSQEQDTSSGNPS